MPEVSSSHLQDQQNRDFNFPSENRPRPLVRPPENYRDRADRGMDVEHQNFSQEHIHNRAESLRREASGYGKISDTFFHGDPFPFFTARSTDDPADNETNFEHIRRKLGHMKDVLAKRDLALSEQHAQILRDDEDVAGLSKVDVGTSRTLDSSMIDDFIEVVDGMATRIMSGDVGSIKKEEYKFFPTDSGLRDAVQLAVAKQAVVENKRGSTARQATNERRAKLASSDQQQELVPTSFLGKIGNGIKKVGNRLGLMN